MSKEVCLKETYDSAFNDELYKIASGDMLQYFQDHPDKLKKKLNRDRMKERLKRMKARRDPDGIEKDAAIPAKAISGEVKFLIGKLTKREVKSPIKEKAKEQIEDDGHQKTAQPSQAQAEAGNYKMKHIRYNGMEISIENPAGSNRSGVSGDGKKWTSHMFHHYGYIRGTMGKDKDHVDVFIKPGTKETVKVFIVNQQNKDDKFDEHKCMLGFDTKDEAQKAYLKNYEKGWKVGPTVEMDIKSFKKWVYTGRKMGPAKTKVVSVEKTAYMTEVYEEAFFNELEKNAKIGGILKNMLQIGKADAAKGRLFKRMKEARPGVSNLTQSMRTSKGNIRLLERGAERSAGRINSLSNKGIGERVFGKRFGFADRRVGKLQAERGKLKRTYGKIDVERSSIRDAAQNIRRRRRGSAPAINKAKRDFRNEMFGIRAKQGLTVAAGTAVAGAGASGVINYRRNRNRYY